MVCVKIYDLILRFFAMEHTLSLTKLKEASVVNVERSVNMSKTMNDYVVQEHIYETGIIAMLKYQNDT